MTDPPASGNRWEGTPSPPTGRPEVPPASRPRGARRWATRGRLLAGSVALVAFLVGGFSGFAISSARSGDRDTSVPTTGQDGSGQDGSGHNGSRQDGSGQDGFRGGPWGDGGSRT